MAERVWLTYSEAAVRVSSNPRTIRRWAAAGMPMKWQPGTNGRERVVDEKVLLRWWRDRMNASPVHFYRKRREGITEGAWVPTAPKPPAQVSESHTGDEWITDRPVNPLAEMKPLRGGPEYRELHEALKTTQPGCRGIDAFTADRVDPEEIPVLEAICAPCDVFKLCHAFPVKAGPMGFWAGQDW